MPTMIPSIDNPICQKCGLWEGCRHPFMETYGGAEPKVLVIGEAPGAEEDKQGIPFIGPSGGLLRNVLTELDLDVDTDVQFTNVVRCRPPDNKITKQAITACSGFAKQGIIDSGAKIIFIMGNSPLSGILGENGISAWNGSTIVKGDITYVPLFHPAYILRDNSHLDEWLDAMAKALDGGNSDHKDFIRTYPETINDLWDMRDYLKDFAEIAYDTETNTLDCGKNDATILCVSFAAGDHSYSVPLYHKESWFAGWDLDAAVGIVKDILQSHNILGHNTKFDLMMTYRCLGQRFTIGGDTMLMSHLLNSRGGIHGLKRLAGIHLGMYGYEEDLEDYKCRHKEADPERGGNYGEVPIEKLLPYNAQDSEAVYRLDPILWDQLSDKQRNLYTEGILAVSEALMETQYNGLAVDDYVAKRYQAIYKLRQSEAYQAILEDAKVQKITIKHQKECNAVNASHPKRKPIKFHFNPSSRPQLRELYFDNYHIPVLARSEKTKDPSTSSKLYTAYEIKYPILHKVRYWALISNMLSKYLGPIADKEYVSDDDSVRTTFNQHGTVTGRTSSSDPFNLQNVPTPEKEPGTLLESLPIKNIFTHRAWPKSSGPLLSAFPNGALVNMDYSGMELRVFSSLAKCKLMIAIIKSGLDTHRMVAAASLRMVDKDDIVNLDTTNPKEVKAMDKIISKIDKPTRYKYKWTNWTLLYGGNEYTLSNLYDIPEDEAKETVHLYYDIFPEVVEFKEWTTAFAEDHGYIESPFGRRELMPYITDSDRGMRNRSIREAVNMPVQSAAGETTLLSLAIIHIQMQQRGMRSKLVNTVHDSILGDCPADEILPFAALAKNVMENIPMWAAYYMPHIPFDWLLCPLVADVAMGTHYGCEEDWESICQTMNLKPELLTHLSKSIVVPSAS